MTPYEITGLGVLISYYLIKWWRGREKKEIDDSYYNLDLCSRRHKKTDNNISSFTGLGGYLPGFTDGYWTERGLQGSSKQIQMEQALLQVNDAFEQRTGVHTLFTGCKFIKGEKYYPGKVIFVDPAYKPMVQKIVWPKREEEEEEYGDEYWRILKEKLRREREDGG